MKARIIGLVMSLMISVVLLSACGSQAVTDNADKKGAGSGDIQETEQAIASGDIQGTEQAIASGDVQGKEIHLAVIIGSHSNAPRPNLGLIEDWVYNACFTFGSVTLVCDDGDPYTIVVDIPAQEPNLSSNKYKQIANEQTKQILDAASQMRAKTDEVDTLRSIQLGARSLKSAEAENEEVDLVRQMIVLDSCLSTIGVLSFSEHNLTTIDIEDIVAQLETMSEIPELDDVYVIVYTCGDTAGKKQKPLNQANRAALNSVWEAILKAGNADVDMKDGLPLSATYDEESMPAVTPVTVVQESVEIHDVKAVEDALADGGVISFDEKSIAFCPGTAQLADPEAAKKALAYVVEYMTDHPDFSLLICGTTACWGGVDYCMNLSDERAAAIGRLLVDELGIDPSRIQSAGVGYSFAEFYTYDQTPEGELDQTIAPVNRSVKLLDLKSDTAARILSTR